MNVRRALALLASSAFIAHVTACGGSATTQPAPGPAAPGPAEPPTSGERPEMTTEDCTAQGGDVVGDIGDGAIHRPSYRCPSGSPPIGRIPLGVEGSVCCT